MSNIDYQQACQLRDEIIKKNETDVSKCVSVATVLSGHADTLMEKGDYEASLDVLLDVSDLVVKKRIGRPEIAKELRLSTLKRICAISDKLIIKYTREKRILNVAETRLMKAAIVSKKSINDFALANDEIFRALKLYMQVVWKIESNENLYLQYYYITENCFKVLQIFERRNKVISDSASVNQLQSSFASLSITNDSTDSCRRWLRNIEYCFDLAKTKFIETFGRSISKQLQEKKISEVAGICDNLIPIISNEIFPELRESLELYRTYCRVGVRMLKSQ